MPQPVEVDGILVATRDRTDARHHHFEHRVPDAARIAVIWHRIGKAACTPQVLRSALLSRSRPPFEDWLPPPKSAVSFLRRTADRSKGSGVSSVMAAVALG